MPEPVPGLPWVDVPFEGTRLFAPDGDADRAIIVNAIQHDIRQPLAVIAQANHLLLKETDSPGAIRLIRAQESAVGSLTRVFDAALDFFKLGLNSIEVDQKACLIYLLLSNLREMHERDARHKGVLDFRVRSPHLSAVTDHHLLTRILSNLVVNSLTHSKASRLLVGARHYRVAATAAVADPAVEEGLQFEIVDNGVGIPPREQLHIFRLGVRGASAQRIAGKGLGLYTVHGLVHALGGRIRLRSRPGLTHFRVQLPCYVERELPVVMPPPRTDGLVARLVVILDEDPTVLEIMRITFENFGAKVLAYSDTLAMLTGLANLPRTPDLFLLDFMIGAHPVAGILPMLRSRFEQDDLPVVIITGQSQHPQLRGLNPQIPVLTKPLRPEHLSRIGDLLADRQPFTRAAFE